MYNFFTLNTCRYWPYVRKYLLIMKITTLILFVGLMHASATVFSQKVTIKSKNTTLQKVFTQISKQTGYNLFWSSQSIEDLPKVDVELENTSMEDALNAVLKGTPL